MSATITAYEHNGTIALTGKLTIATIENLWSNSQLVFTNAKNPLHLDLQGVTQSDSAGIALLIAWVRLAHKQQKEIYFLNLPKQMREAIHVSGLQNILPIHKTSDITTN